MKMSDAVMASGIRFRMIRMSELLFAGTINTPRNTRHRPGSLDIPLRARPYVHDSVAGTTSLLSPVLMQTPFRYYRQTALRKHYAHRAACQWIGCRFMLSRKCANC